MNIKYLLSFCFLVVSLCCLQSCKKDALQITDTAFLSGNWVVVNAKRNAKATTTLNEAYFVFNPDSTMRTNFMGEEITGDYKINGNIINQGSQQDPKDKKLSYTIVDLSKDSLILSTRIMDYDFEFYLLNERLDPFNRKEDESDLIGIPQDQLDIES